MEDLQSPDHTPGIVNVHNLARLRVGAHQGSDGISDLLESCSEFDVGRGKLERIHDRAKVEPGAADYEYFIVLVNHLASGGLKLGDAVLDFGLDQVDHEMTNSRLFLDAGLGRADVHPPVHLHAVNGDDRSVVPSRQF
jgi:hypothetical protein